ncbi:MAG TPA: T9SS type A sorting domain-containing protein [Bacteroidia bacterium]|jgi:hypothetical protein|nr:T9SS type A sorting domain-containing protein [Bacteroidia bacterium]
MKTVYHLRLCALFGLLCYCGPSLHAQQQPASKIELIPCTRVVDPSKLVEDPWDIHIGVERERNPLNPELQKAIAEKTRIKQEREKRDYQAPPPAIQTLSPEVPTLKANFTTGLTSFLNPPDNGTAVGNGKFILHSVNSSYAVFDTLGNAVGPTHSLTTFFGLPSGSYITDPRVIYDAFADRFIMAITGDSYTEFIAFSQTNDPSGAWNTYSYIADSTGGSGSGSYLDYPYIGINEHELFMQVLNTSSHVGTMLQISKQRGYSGGTLQVLKHSIGGNTCAVNYGQSQSPYGTKFYFVETPGGNKINLYEVSDTIGASPVINTYNLTVGFSYSTLANASQKGTSTSLVLTDNRIQNAFFLNGMIHFGFMTDSNSFGVLLYNRLDLATKTITTYSHSAANSDLAQPSIASFATSPTDKSVILCYQESNTSIYPSIRAILCDDAGNWSAPLTIKDGQGYLSGGRWGDYTSCTRAHNAKAPTVWLSAEYGASGNKPATYIAQVTMNPGTATGLSTLVSTTSKMKVFPNPVADSHFSILFELEENLKKVEIGIYDARGRLVKTLFSGPCYEGETTLVFNTTLLAKGMYFIRMNNGETCFKTMKLMVD